MSNFDLWCKYTDIDYSKIEIEYDGEWPAACMGCLTIKYNGTIVYSEKYKCYSTGDVYFDDDWNDYIEPGDLLWDTDKYPHVPHQLVEMVNERLSEVEVCCGGCI